MTAIGHTSQAGAPASPAPSHREPSSNPGAARLVMIVALIVLAGLCAGSAIRSVHHLNKALAHGPVTEINDFDRWMQRMPALLHDHADLPDERSINTIPDLLILSPLLHLSRAGQHVAWTLCKFPMVVAITFFALWLIRRAGIALSPFALLLLFAAWLWPVLGDIQEGQTNLLMLLPLVAGLWAAQRDRRPADWLAGLLLSLAVAIKVTPLVFLPYFLLRRRWTIAIAMTLGLIFWFLLVPALAFGWAQNLRWESQWFHIMILPFAKTDVRVLMGESLPSFLTKLLRHVPAFISDKTGTPVFHFINIADLPAPAVAWIIRLTLLSIVAAGLWWMRRPLGSLRTRRFLFESAALACFMLWASSWTLVAHYVTLLIPLAAVAMIQSDPASSPRVRRHAAIALIIAAICMLLTSDLAKWLFGPDGREYMLALNVCLLASVALIAIVASASRRCSAPGKAPPPRLMKIP